MKVWINSSELSGVTDGLIVLNYVEEPTRENNSLGSITQHVDKLPKWFCQGEKGEADTIEEAKKIVENKIN